MNRITPIYSQDDYPSPTENIKTELNTLFTFLFPDKTNNKIDENHKGIAIAAHNPALALHLAQMSKFIVLEQTWCERLDLRELTIQTVNTHFSNSYSFDSRIEIAESCGISRKLQHAIAKWETSPLFNEEQRLVIQYTFSVVQSDVSSALLDKVKERFGEKGAVECTALISFFAFWAMFLNATNAD